MYFKYPLENCKYFTSVKKLLKLHIQSMLELILTNTFQNETENNESHLFMSKNKQ